MITEYTQAPAFADKELVEGLLSNDERIIDYFFFKKCSLLFGYIIKNVLDYRANSDELISELYIYLQENDWHKLRQFDYRSKLTTWLSVIAVRFFIKARGRVIENYPESTLYIDNGYDMQERVASKIDVDGILNKMSNERYREVLYNLFIEDMEPQVLADKLGMKVDNLYNLKRRALAQLIKMTQNERE